jgi:isopentenyldiphosphate isomerase
MTKKVNKFKPKPGQVDFTHARWAPVINCVVKYKDKILVVQRSSELNFYPEYWNGISGFLDDKKSLEKKVEEELREELGIAKKYIRKIKVGEIFDQDEPKYHKTWIVHPILVEVATDKIKLDWESQNYRWIKPSKAKKLKLLPGFDKVLEKICKIKIKN